MKKHPNSFLLAWHIADRTQRTSCYNEAELQPGEAMLGDYRQYGLTEQKYRTAKAVLEKHGFATFKTTNKGTIARLSDTRLYAVALETDNEPINRQTTDRQRTDNEQTTTTNTVRREDRKEKEKDKAIPLSPFSGVPKDKSSELQTWHDLYVNTTGQRIIFDANRERQWWEWLCYGNRSQPEGFTPDDFKLVIKTIRKGIAERQRNRGALKFDNLIGNPSGFEQDLAQARTVYGNWKPATDTSRRAAPKPTPHDPREKPFAAYAPEEIEAGLKQMREALTPKDKAA